MPDVTFTTQRFPAGTSVGAYPKSNWPGAVSWPEGAAVGSATATATVSATSTLALTGLAAETDYFLYASVGGEHRYVSFSTRTGPETVEGLDTRMDTAEAALAARAGIGDLGRMYNSGGTQVIPKDGAFHVVTLFDTVILIGDGWTPDESGGTSFTVDPVANTITCLHDGIVSAFVNLDGDPLVTDNFLSVSPLIGSNAAAHAHGTALFLPLKANDGAGGNGGGELLLGCFPVKAGQAVKLRVSVPTAAPSAFTLTYVDLELMMVSPGPIAWPQP